jgi:Predicted secreted protein
MALTSAIVLYAVTWFMTMLVALPIGLKTQGDLGEKVEGTHDGAPANYNPKRKALWVTIVATAIWALLVAVILSGWVSWHDFDWTAKLPSVADS